MPLARGQVEIDTSGSPVVLEPEPFEWPRNAWEMLELRFTRETGWATLTGTSISALRTLYGAAHGSVDDGLVGKIVQYAAGTGHVPFTVTDWRSNSGSFVFSPGDGLEIQEIHGAAEGGITYYVGTLRLVPV